ncbi:MAG: hypothetical protein U5Q44_06475 [Dehalococcoidia bacterium]|nr:hypothetical protein [Dehalococcoidia bacterium]
MPTEHNDLEEQMSPDVQREVEAYGMTYAGYQATASSNRQQQAGSDSQQQTQQQS